MGDRGVLPPYRVSTGYASVHANLKPAVPTILSSVLLNYCGRGGLWYFQTVCASAIITEHHSSRAITPRQLWT